MSENFRVSVSKTKTWIQCKKQYEFNYIHKLPKQDQDFHIFGKFCHEVLENFHKEYIKGSTKPYNISMSDAFKNAIIVYKDAMTAEMKKGCKAIIQQYLNRVCQEKIIGRPANVIDVEKRFETHIKDNIVLNGAIDRIEIDPDGVIHVGDYKTTKDKKYLKDDFFQLLTYAFVLMSEDPTLQIVRGSYILLRHDFEYITTQFSREEAMTVEDKYADYVNQMRTEKTFSATTQNLCKFCSWLDKCPEGTKMLQPSTIHGAVSW